MKLSLFIGEAQSLKDKRHALEGLKDRLRSRFNVSVAETAHQDMHQRAEIAVAAVSNDGKYLNGLLDSVLNYVKKDGLIVLAGHEIEVF